jgi:hypothetical protein
LIRQYHCPQCEQKEGEHVYNGMASLSFTGQETTIHGMFHTYTHKPDFIYTTAECLTYMAVYLSLAVWTYGIQVPSGLFVPGIITGCSFGRLTGEWVRYVLCQGDTLSSISTGDTDGWCTKEEGGTAVRPGTYAFIGAAPASGCGRPETFSGPRGIFSKRIRYRRHSMDRQMIFLGRPNRARRRRGDARRHDSDDGLAVHHPSAPPGGV